MIGYKDFGEATIPFSVISSNQSVGSKYLLELNICHRFLNTNHENGGICNASWLGGASGSALDCRDASLHGGRLGRLRLCRVLELRLN